MNRFLSIVALMFSVLTAAGQGVVTGTVTDSLTGEALQYAAVGVVGAPTGTTTDARGHYRLKIDSKDSVTLQYSYVGYRTLSVRVAVKGTLQCDVALHPSAQQLEGVEINDEKVRHSQFTQIGVEKLDDAVGPMGGVEGLVKMLPDVQSNNELSSQYSVRGGSFDENLVYINEVEVFRPMLIRSAQQEGMSIINPDLVSYILFSPGGFDATYGDRMSSVLDITYKAPGVPEVPEGSDKPEAPSLQGKISASLLGATATLKGLAGKKLSYALGLRYHDNGYVLGSLDTKGRYTTRYSDLQALMGYKANERLDLGLLAVWTRNIYGLVPESQTTTFGGFFLPLELRVYFDGQEQDKYNTLLGAVTADWRPTDDWRLKGSLSAQHINESERYDVQSQYWLYELAMGQTAGDTVQFDRGVGTFLEHARNSLLTDIVALDLKATRQALLGSWVFGLKVQGEQIDDRLREWKWVDSAGYALPTNILPFGDTNNYPVAPILQHYAHACNTMQTLRGTAFVQRDVAFTTRRGAEVKMVAGLRGQLYGGSHTDGMKHLLSPRLSGSYKPNGKQDLLFRLAAGIYQQAPFYREYRRADGSLATGLPPQTSYQVTVTGDWKLRIWERPFTITADLYYKYITDLIPYSVDNLRLRYLPDESAVGYATGLSLRVNAELIDGLESWASISLMQTQEDIAGDGLGWLARPTDQRFSLKLFLQDNVPSMPWWRMSFNLVYGSGIPVSIPFGIRGASSYRLPAYYRADWGNSVQLSHFPFYKRSRVLSKFKDIQVGVEVFNLFNFRNVVSYLWVSDYDNRYYPVPNYLTARQPNIKVTVLF